MRVSRHQMFMNIARAVSQRSTCPRLNVGAIVIVNKRVVSIGYNGSPPHIPHCTEVGCQISESGGCTRSIHAEANALRFVPVGLRNQPKEVYITDSPCSVCVERIINGIVEAVYFENFYRDDTGIQRLLEFNIRVHRIVPSGYMIDQRNGHIAEAR